MNRCCVDFFNICTDQAIDMSDFNYCPYCGEEFGNDQ